MHGVDDLRRRAAEIRRTDHARQVFELMLELNRELGTALIIVTHAPELAAQLQRSLTLSDGQLHG